MSKIYDALQIAHGQRAALAKEQEDAATVVLPSLVKERNPFPFTRLYQDSELLVLAQNIAARLPDPEKNVIQFIGSKEGEGTSTLVRELAVTLAQQSTKPVLLIEADHIKPFQYQAFGVEAKPPLDQLLHEGNALNGVLAQVQETNLFLATLSSESQSSLTRRSFWGGANMWKAVRDKFSLILIDSSPVSSTPDCLAVCGTVDGIVLVVEAEKTRAVVVHNVKEQILMNQGNLLGMVFTKRKFHVPKFLYKML
ncbi:MAG: hypothetical protein NPIRA05_02270 [Nitrospirales bacterium]|nr:MAG: hypothetical protein NPIRA05_02270 [Nitrospirales bacterium]